jgi:hypothetical protein
MGSFIEINDTLQISKEQGFPNELDFEKHKVKPFTANDFAGKIFEFQNKPNIRIYHAPPVRTFLVENIDGKWLYWGLVHILEVRHDLENKTTSGKYKIITIYPPDKMKTAFELIDERNEISYLSSEDK